ncbi:UDP-N-acetylmuramoyl-L-alanyl-D-glutamate--2,6-diaminopimelate ligase [Candidatus Falkowbacteria bacterium]|nr:UDP-N-acetylmuramoyl-L-alanyl-D-glutamate--2,6-diaminopimelate ligase [Candidatus Falkowbacteria bacterium]
MLKKIIKKMLPKNVLGWYHFLLAKVGAMIYGFPSRKMVIIGITGTKGKTSTANFIWSVLNAAGFKTGIITTANIRIGEQESLNKYHMTMPGRFILQKTMAEMVDAKCKFCVVETTSEGIKQWRHIGIDYDVAVFTNLSPEHLAAHENSFEKYKEAKGKMFAALNVKKRKIIDGREIQKVIIANFDDENKDFFLNFAADKKITFGLDSQADVVATNIDDAADGVTFNVSSNNYRLNIVGGFNVHNALPAIVVAKLFDINDATIQRGLENLAQIPGRMEEIKQGQNFRVFVDYAHEPKSMEAALNTSRKIVGNGKLIVLLGAEGRGRDKTKRPAMGKVAGELADFVVISNVDPYEDDAAAILRDIKVGAEMAGKIENINLFVIEDRRAGIRRALKLANTDDIVLITGKGAEQSITIAGVKYPWDDRIVVSEELAKISENI